MFGDLVRHFLRNTLLPRMDTADPLDEQGVVVNTKDADAGLIAHLSPFFLSFCSLCSCFSRIQFGKPSLPAICKLALEGDLTWDAQFDLCSSRGAAPDIESRAGFLCPLAHSRKSPMPVTARPKHSGVNPATVITDE